MLRLDDAQKEGFKHEILRLIIDIYGERSSEDFSAEAITGLLDQLDRINESRVLHLVDNAHMIYSNLRPYLVEGSPKEPLAQIRETEVPLDSPEQKGEAPGFLIPESIEMPQAVFGKLYEGKIDLEEFTEGPEFDAQCPVSEMVKGLHFHKNLLQIEGVPETIGQFVVPFSFLADGKMDRTVINLHLSVIPDIESPIPSIELGRIPVGEKFETTLEIDKRHKHQFEMTGLEETGLVFDPKSFTLSGVPEAEGAYKTCLNFLWEGFDEEQPGSIDIEFSFFSDPQTIWEVHDPDPADVYPKSLDDHKSVKIGRDLLLVAASKRGRAHEHNGTHREDDFHVRAHNISGWIVMAVADGTGSAPYSRKGSELACKVAEQVASKRLEERTETADTVLENALRGKEGADQALQDLLTFTLTTAVYNAFLYIKRFAVSENKSLDEFGTTLRLTICKPMGAQGYFVGSLAIGNGATVIYHRKTDTIELLHQNKHIESPPAEKKLLTIPGIGEHTAKLNQHIAYRFVENLSAVMTMTNGVSDAVFGKEKGTSDPSQWATLFQNLKNEVFDKTRNTEEVDDLLLEWLKFWAPGEVDDRTMAILWSE